MVYKAGPAASSSSLPEIFARITVTEAPTPEKETEGQDGPGQKLGLVMLLERDPEDGRLEWTYFDLQDPFVPGLDRRPWHSALRVALSSVRSDQGAAKQEEEGLDLSAAPTTGEEFWADYHDPTPVPPTPVSTTASNTTTSTTTTPRAKRIFSPEDIFDHVRTTPGHRRRPPSVDASSSERGEVEAVDVPEEARTSNGPRRVGALANRTTGPESDKGPATQAGTDLEAILSAAGIVNLPPSLSSAAARAFASTVPSAPAGTTTDAAPRRRGPIGGLRPRTMPSGSAGSGLGSGLSYDRAAVEASAADAIRNLRATFPHAPARLTSDFSTAGTTATTATTTTGASEGGLVNGAPTDGTSSMGVGQPSDSSSEAEFDSSDEEPETTANDAGNSRDVARPAGPDGEAELEAALRGVFNLFVGRRRRSDATTRRTAGERFVAVAHRVAAAAAANGR